MTREEKALKIAKYEGWRLWTESDNYYTVDKPSPALRKEDLQAYYSSYNGLMPILDDANNNSVYCKFTIDFTKIFVEKYLIDTKGNTKKYEKNFYIDADEYPLIDALQEAIIFYHQNKESGE